MPVMPQIMSCVRPSRAGGRRALALAALLSLLALAWWWLSPPGVSAHANLASAEPAPNSELALAWWWLSPPGVSAHANLASAEPAPNSELATAPDRVIIWFTEPIRAGPQQHPGTGRHRAAGGRGQQCR